MFTLLHTHLPDLQQIVKSSTEEMEVDSVSQAVDAMTEILKLAQSVSVAQKLIKLNVENVVGMFQDEQMGKIIDLYV